MDIKVNGKTHNLVVDNDMPLLWVLRDELNIKGPKYGCGIAMCGACTVHIEGQGTPSSMHVVQKAWVEHQVAQCGYCQPGQIMSAVALLTKNTSPTDSDIDNAMSGNLCRCGTYPKIRAAIKTAAINIIQEKHTMSLIGTSAEGDSNG